MSQPEITVPPELVLQKLMQHYPTEVAHCQYEAATEMLLQQNARLNEQLTILKGGGEGEHTHESSDAPPTP